MFRRLLLFLALPALVAASGQSESPQPAPTLWLPAAADSAPLESDPAPFLTPARPDPGDTARRSLRQQAQEQYERGLALERRHPAAAVVAYLAAIRIDPTLPEAHYRAGLLFNRRAQWAQAASAFAGEIEHHPGHPEAGRELGIALARSGDHPRAIQQLELLSRRNPRDGRVWHALGFAYQSAGRTRDAEKALRRATALPPDEAEEHRDLGVALAESGRIAEARAEYRRALALAPGDASAWLNLGNLERRAGRRDSAVALYRRALAVDSAFVPALRAQAQTLRDGKREDEAAGVYQEWLSRRPADHMVRAEAVQFLNSMGRAAEALEVAEGAVRAAPRSAPAHVLYGMALAGAGRAREGIERLREGQRMYGTLTAEGRQVEAAIAALRARAPDSLRAVFQADSVAHSTTSGAGAPAPGRPGP